MSTRETKTVEILGGLRKALAILLGFGWLGLVFAGMAVAFTPSPHSPVVGWLLLGVAALILNLTMNYWVRFLFAVLVPGVLGGLLIMIDGHALNHPEVQVSRLDGVIMTLLIAASAVVAFTFSRRKLKLTDRIALFAFVLCIFGQSVVPRFMLLAIGVGFACLVIAWGIDKTLRRNRGAGETEHSRL